MKFKLNCVIYSDSLIVTSNRSTHLRLKFLVGKSFLTENELHVMWLLSQSANPVL